MALTLSTVNDFKNALLSAIINTVGAINTSLTDQSWIVGWINGTAEQLALLENKANVQITSRFILDNLFGTDLDSFASFLFLSRNPATQASGNIFIQGTVGTDIPVGTIFTSGPNTYNSISDAVIQNNTIGIMSITRLGTLATAATNSAHGLSTGSFVSITGANQSEYNLNNVQVSVISDTQFTYSVNISATTPATGTIFANFTGATVNIQSLLSGASYNISAGTIMSIGTIINNANSAAGVNYDGISGGTNIESDTNFRNRIQLKLFFNTQNYTNNGLPQILKQTFPQITRVYITQNFINSLHINKITKTNVAVPTPYSDPFYRIVETSIPHGLVNGQPISNITGAAYSSLNVTNGIVSRIYDPYRFSLYVGNSTYEDSTSPNMLLIPLTPNASTVFFLEDNNSNIFPSSTDVASVLSFIKDSVLPFNNNGNFMVASPVPLLINFNFTSITPNTNAMRTAVINNLIDYFKFYAGVGQTITQLVYNNIIANTIDINANPITNYVLSSPSGNIVPNINELPYITTNSITFS